MKSSLPIASIPRYDPIDINRWYYTVVFMGDYLFDTYKEGVGSHTGVDIDATKYPSGHVSVIAVMNGVVEKVSFGNTGFGYHLVIKHENVPDPDDKNKTTTLRSSYCHMSDIIVSVGQNVKSGDKIGTTGSTGNSSGAHLHFQIDRDSAPFFPYWPFTNQEAKISGYSTTWEAISAGLNKDKVAKYCVSPMSYIQQYLDGVDIFPDVNQSNSQFSYILNLYQKGIVKGYPTGFFLPNRDITRAEFIKMIYTAKGTDTNSVSFADKFSDVQASAWYAPYVSLAYYENLASGYSDGRFYPDRLITRAEAVKMLAVVSKKKLSNFSDVFADINKEMWFSRYVMFAKENNLLNFDKYFYPLKPVNRGDACEMIYKIFFSVNS